MQGNANKLYMVNYWIFQMLEIIDIGMGWMSVSVSLELIAQQDDGESASETLQNSIHVIFLISLSFYCFLNVKLIQAHDHLCAQLCDSVYTDHTFIICR